jgi:hypothetical protein
MRSKISPVRASADSRGVASSSAPYVARCRAPVDSRITQITCIPFAAPARCDRSSAGPSGGSAATSCGAAGRGPKRAHVVRSSVTAALRCSPSVSLRAAPNGPSTSTASASANHGHRGARTKRGTTSAHTSSPTSAATLPAVAYCVTESRSAPPAASTNA